jgi:hypothetical protein
LRAEWATNAPGISAPLAVFVRASDQRMFIQSRHAQLRQPAAIQGYQQLAVNGMPQTPVRISSEAFEWAFPVIAVSAPVPPGTNATAAGSSTVPVNGSVGPMQPAGSQATAACQWQFGQGSDAPAPPTALQAQAVPLPPTAVGAAPTTSTPPVATSPAPAEPAAPILTATPLGPGALPVATLCTLRGPEPRPNGPPSYASPGAATLYWQLIPGARSYVVSRSDLGVLTSRPLAATEYGFLHRATFRHPATYVYTITANYPQGCGMSTVSLAAPLPSTPPVTHRMEGVGRVTLQWAWGNDPRKLSLQDFSGVLVTGPALPFAGQEIRNHGIGADHILISGIPAGSRTWTVKAFWDTPGGRVMDDTGRTITVNVP